MFGSAKMLEFIAENEEIELKYYDQDATLSELSASLEAFRLSCGLKTSECRGCGECCSDNIPVLGLDIPTLLEGLHIDFSQAIQSILVLPERPDLDFRRKAIKEMAQSASISTLEAALLFEYNNAEPIILARRDGLSPQCDDNPQACCFLQDNLCSRYTVRPYSCGLYLCNMGERLSYIQEMIVRQGTWHAYFKLGWIEEEEIVHNPFLKADSYDKLLVSDFEFKLESTLEQLFFYF
jgi:Fe-S-cluster containining protein